MIHDFIDALEVSQPLSTHVLFGLRFESFTTLVVSHFSSFKGITHAYLQKSVKYNKNIFLSCICLIIAYQ